MKTRGAGFTLIEILIALFVLLIGLSSMLGLLFVGRRISNTTVDRNIAQSIITEAVADIERAHLITADTTFGDGHKVTPDEEGLLIETVASPNANIHNSSYATVKLYGQTFGDLYGKYIKLACFNGALPSDTSTFLWPYYPNFANQPPSPKFIGGMTNNPSDKQAIAYRVIYRLERHPQWGNDYKGIYVLTLVVYRDLKRKGAWLEQVTDPVVVYLRDKKVWD